MDSPDELSVEQEALYEMSDEELDLAFKEAKNAMNEEPEETVEDDVEDIVEDEPEVEEVEEDEEIEDDTEQPEEDSDLDNQAEDEEVEEDIVEDPEAADETVDDKSDIVEEKPVEAEAKPKLYKVKANGTEFEFTDEELMQLAPKAMNYTQKMQEIAPWRKTISALKDNDIGEDDINLMIDVLKGNKEAITEVVKKAGLDTMDIDTENNSYERKQYGRSETELAIEDVVNTIAKDPEYKITQHVVDSQWDSNSRQKLAENPDMISGLHDDIKSGVFDQVSPMAMKMKVLDGAKKSDIDYYIEAGSQYYRDKQVREQAETLVLQESKEAEDKLLQEKKVVEDVKKREVKQTTVKKAANKRKAAAPTRKAAGKKDVIDYLDDSDEKFDDWYKKLEASL